MFLQPTETLPFWQKREKRKQQWYHCIRKPITCIQRRKEKQNHLPRYYKPGTGRIKKYQNERIKRNEYMKKYRQKNETKDKHMLASQQCARRIFKFIETIEIDRSVISLQYEITERFTKLI